MCGVFGFACNRPTKSMYNLATAVLVETEIRGPHATGHAFLDTKGRVKHQKHAVKSSEYVDLPEWKRMKKNMPRRLLGHCRFTTHGSELDNQNNHPHVGNRYALIHNGILKRFEYNPWKELCQTECDSEAILRVMELGHDPIQAAARVFNAFYSSNFAVLALDKQTREIHFFRNPERPLRVWRGKDFVLIASTEDILEKAFVKTFGIASTKVEGLDKWTPISGTFYTVKPDLEVVKKELFDYSPPKPTLSLPTKVQQYSHYSVGSKGNGEPSKAVRVDEQGNLIYTFDK